MVDGLVVEADIPYTDLVECHGQDCRVPLDALATTEGEGLPTFVLVPGGPVSFAERRYMDALAAAIARRGAVAFLATYRSPATGDTGAESLIDVRCAIRFAREHAPEYGGDPERVILLGHSFGSLLAIQTGVDNDTESPGCSADGNGVPEVVIGLSTFNPDISMEASAGPTFRLAGGSNDPASARGPEMAERLADAGFDAEYLEFEGAGHESMVMPETEGLLDFIFAAVE